MIEKVERLRSSYGGIVTSIPTCGAPVSNSFPGWDLDGRELGWVAPLSLCSVGQPRGSQSNIGA